MSSFFSNKDFMNKIITALLAAALLKTTAVLAAEVERREQGQLVLENIPAIPAEIRDRLSQYSNARSAALADWLPDGKGLLIRTRFADTMQLHQVSQPLGMRKQLTFFNEPIAGGQYQPGPGSRGFIYSRDNGGDENYQLYFFDSATGKSALLSDGSSRNQSVCWAPSGQFFIYSSTRRNGTDFDLYLHDMATGTERALYNSAGSFSTLDISRDEKTALLMQYVSATESRLFSLDIETGQATSLNIGTGRVSYGEALFSKDGKGIYLTLDAGGEFQQLGYYDLARGRLHNLTPDLRWDVGSIALSDDGNLLAYSVNEDGLDKLYILDVNARKQMKAPVLPPAVLTGFAFSPDSQRLALSFSAADAPSDAYVFDLKSGTLNRWTESEVGGLDRSQFLLPELVHFPTFDQVNGKPRQIPAFVYKPQHGQDKLPVVISIHGGPESQYRPSFSEFAQYLSSEVGVAFIAPNVRGSSGYGKSYLELDNGYKREDSVRDIGALLDWIATQPDLDKDRVLVMGGSYGGYMTLASLTHYNARLKAGIDIVGISHFVTFLNNTKGYRADLRRVEYGDERDPAMREHLETISPLNNAARITVPLFVAQGLNDPRVPASEAEQIVSKVRANQGEVWYLLAKDEGHGFNKKGNREFYQAAAVTFIRKHLLGP
ncbi:S9 family peptidase [Permianibacter fluminis]|uniref:S9 family peptidase n=1 Tax=Permianibacter fluminis TaxID=2738515 RepID=UPI001B7D8F4B|nr:prolyl oligopeptidase family serine peptidase [Permianibacter fluminis]